MHVSAFGVAQLGHDMQATRALEKLLARGKVAMALMARVSQDTAAPAQTVKLAWDSGLHPFLPTVTLQKLVK